MAGEYERDMASRPDDGDRADRAAVAVVDGWLADYDVTLPSVAVSALQLRIAHALRHGRGPDA